MKTVHDLSQLSWQLSGWAPHFWRFSGSMETGATALAEVSVPAPVPGSVQVALRAAELLPDWNVGLNALSCEWVENRHWIYEAILPDDWVESDATKCLKCQGLDYSGWILVNGQEIGAFCGSFVPHQFDLTPFLGQKENRLSIVFDVPPRWLGQFGYTSQMTEWKPRFNYTWDWTARLVQIGIWDTLSLEFSDGDELAEVQCVAHADSDRGTLALRGVVHGDQAHSVRVALEGSDATLRDEVFSLHDLQNGIFWRDLAIELWQPNGAGAQPLYMVRIQLHDANGIVLDEVTRRIGFKRVEWQACEGAPSDAEPWICVVNGKPLFLQGVNWTPIRPNFADLTRDDYRQRLELYRDLGCNVLRVWGGAFLEPTTFYDLCDELGLLVWQEFPMSSSGVENWPPEDDTAIADMESIARSYIERRQHHASLLLWCGGNELQGALDGGKVGIGKPIDATHPMMARLKTSWHRKMRRGDFCPHLRRGRVFWPTQASLVRDSTMTLHGPWIPAGTLDDWETYWQNDDALFRSETGHRGTSGATSFAPMRASVMWCRGHSTIHCGGAFRGGSSGRSSSKSRDANRATSKNMWRGVRSGKNRLWR